MKRKFFGTVGTLAFLLALVPLAAQNTPAAPRDGIYTFNPRPQATSAGQRVAAYLDKVMVSSGYIVFFLTSAPGGKGKLSDIPGYWGTGNSKGTVVLQNLDNQALSYNDVDADSLMNETGQYVAFASVVGNRFSLTYPGRPPIVFSEIRFREQDRKDSPPDNFVYSITGLDPADFTEKRLADVIAATEQRGNVTVEGQYVSEVAYVGQSGTNVTFKAENVKNRTFQAQIAPSGLSAGQKVRIYWVVVYQASGMNVRELWAVYAIERL